MIREHKTIYFILGDLETPPLPAIPQSDFAKRKLVEAYVSLFKDFLWHTTTEITDAILADTSDLRLQELVLEIGEGIAAQPEMAAQYAQINDFERIALKWKEAAIAAERDLVAQRSRLQETLSALRGSREALAVLDAETRQQALDGLRQSREAIRQLAPDLAKAGQREQLMQLHAPVSGTVQQLAIHTIGGVVTPAQALLAIVPNNEGLEIEAMVQNKDIGFVRPGQRATVKVESFPYTRYGYLQGTIESVSQDAAQDENLGLIFPTRVRLQSATLVIDGAEVRLTPGMSLSVEIKTGKRSVISYLLSPLNRRASESLRER